MAAYEPCTLMLGYADPNESVRDDFIVMNGRGMEASKASYEKLPIVDFFMRKKIWRQGDIMYIDWEPVGTDDWVVASSIMSVPVTFKNMRTGNYEEAEIELVGKYAWTTTLVGTAGVRVEICKYVIPDGMQMVLGHKRAFNSRLLLNPVDAG